MPDLSIRREGRAGRITLTRPQALNALSHAMCLQIEAALSEWQNDDEVALVILDAEGERAFCAGGDIAAMWRAAKSGDHEVGRAFFADEYRMNAAIANYPKPVVSFMQGFVMGGGVGVGGHAGLRVVGDSTRIAMPECGIGLVPDVGGSWLLGRAPGRIGEYLGLTGGRMGPGDAIHAGFADRYIPEAGWPEAIATLVETGGTQDLPHHAPPAGELEARDLSAFGGATLEEVQGAVDASGDRDAASALARNSPLSMAATLAIVRAARGDRQIEQSLTREHRFTHRATAEADFMEGVRAQLIDKDRTPRWSAPCDRAKVEAMLSPLGARDLTWNGVED